MSITIEISNKELQKCIGSLNKYSAKKQQEIKNQVNTSAINIHREAIRIFQSYGVDKNHSVINNIRYDPKTPALFARVTSHSRVSVYFEEGTRAHIIRAKNVRALAFQTPSAGSLSKRMAYYKNRKTGGMQSKPSGDTTIFTKWVRHPGTMKRPFMAPSVFRERPRYYAAMKRILKTI